MKTFSDCMKSWVHMVNEGRYFSDVEENCIDEEQVYEGKNGKVSLTDIAIGNAVDQIKDYFSKGAKVSKETNEATSIEDILAGKAGQTHWKGVGKMIVKPGKILRMGCEFLGDKGPSGTVEVKMEGDKDFREITINGNGPEGDSNIKLTNAEVEKSLKALHKKFGSKKEPKGIDGIIQAVREKLGNPSTDWFYYDSSNDDDSYDADDGKSEWQKKSEQNADDSGQGDDEGLDDINDYANSKSDGGAAANSMTDF